MSEYHAGVLALKCSTEGMLHTGLACAQSDELAGSVCLLTSTLIAVVIFLHFFTPLGHFRPAGQS